MINKKTTRALPKSFPKKTGFTVTRLCCQFSCFCWIVAGVNIFFFIESEECYTLCAAGREGTLKQTHSVWREKNCLFQVPSLSGWISQSGNKKCKGKKHQGEKKGWKKERWLQCRKYNAYCDLDCMRRKVLKWSFAKLFSVEKFSIPSKLQCILGRRSRFTKLSSVTTFGSTLSMHEITINLFFRSLLGH